MTVGVGTLVNVPRNGVVVGKAVASACGWMAVLALAVALRLVGLDRVDPADPAAQPFDGDCQYHRLRAEQIAAHYPHVAWNDPELGDGGTDIPWPPLFDEVIATTARVAAAGRAPTPEGVARAAAWVPVVLGVATVPLVGWLAAVVVGQELALGAALLLALSAGHACYSAFGRSDQHVLELLLHVAILVAYARGLAARTVAARSTAVVALGALVALAFWNWQGSALNLIFLATFVAVWHVVSRRGEGAATPAATLAGGCAVGAAALVASVIAFAPHGALWRGTIAGVTGLHVLLTAATGLFAAALWAVRRVRPEATRTQRAVEAALAGATPLAAALVVPGISGGVSQGLRALLNGNHWYASIAEFQPMLLGGMQPLKQEVIVALAQYGLAPILAVAGAAGLHERWRRGSEQARAAVLLLAVWGAVALALTCARNRFGLYSAPPLAIWCWVGLRHAQGRWVPGLSRGVLGALFAAAAVGVVIAPPLIQYVRYVRAPAAPSPGTLLEWTRGRPDPTGAPAIYARWGWGHHVRALARRPAIANPFGTEGGARGFEESLRVFLSTDEAEVERVLRERRAGYLLAQDPRPDVLNYQDVLPPEARVGEVSSSWRTGTTLVENERYRALVAYRLHFHDGAAADGLPALGGFRLLRETAPADPAKSVEPAYALFGVVPGARLAVMAITPGIEVAATTRIRTNTAREFTWRTTARAGPGGAAVLRVPYATGENGSVYAGPIEVEAGGARREVAITEEAVVAGRTIAVALSAHASGEAPATAQRQDAPR